MKILESIELVQGHLEWYVLNYDHNTGEIKPFNIFSNWVLEEAVIKEINRYLRSPSKYKYEDLTGFKAFSKHLDSLIMWKEWSRCEYEILVKPLSGNIETKVDCYQQCKPNMEAIAREVINQYKTVMNDVSYTGGI